MPHSYSMTPKECLAQKIGVNNITDRVLIEYKSKDSGRWGAIQLTVDEAVELIDGIVVEIEKVKSYVAATDKKQRADKLAQYEALKKELGIDAL